MGWSYSHKGDESLLSFIKRKVVEDTGLQLVDASVKGNTGYVALRDDNGEVSATVVLTTTDNTQYTNIGYKYIHEELGPYHCDCPQRIIKRLTPTTDPYALAWRRACKYQHSPDYSQVNAKSPSPA